MTPESACWILELFLRQPVEEEDEWLLCSIFQSLPIPLPLQNPRLKKTILLRSLLSHLAYEAISEETLRILELVEELDRDHENTPPSSLKSAYCAVAAESAVAYLRKGDYFHRHRLFSDAVHRIWNCRLADLHVSDAAPYLLSNHLTEKSREMEEAVVDSTARRRLLADHPKAIALLSLRVYVDDALREMGPSTLEVMLQDKLKRGAADHITFDGSSLQPRFPTEHHLPTCAGTAEDNAVTRDEVPSLTSLRASKERDFLETPEIVRVKKALKSSCAALQAAVEDPLPGAVAIAEEVLNEVASEPRNTRESQHSLHQQGEDDHGPSGKVRDESPTEGTATTTTAQDQKDQVTKGRSSLMDRNPTGHTHEWHDLIGTPMEGSPNASRRIELPRLKEQRVSPLNIARVAKNARRAAKKWSVIEEDTLREGVKKHGKGNWKFILNCYLGVFKNRTEVDLKDKWRNMSR